MTDQNTLSIFSYVAGCPCCGQEPTIAQVAMSKKTGELKYFRNLEITSIGTLSGYVNLLRVTFIHCVNCRISVSIISGKFREGLKTWNTRLGQKIPAQIYRFPKGFEFNEPDQTPVAEISEELVRRAEKIMRSNGGMN